MNKLIMIDQKNRHIKSNLLINTLQLIFVALIIAIVLIGCAGQPWTPEQNYNFQNAAGFLLNQNTRFNNTYYQQPITCTNLPFAGSAMTTCR